MKLQTEEMPKSPRELNPEIPEAVEAAIMQSIAKNPDERFQTAGDFRETLIDAGFASSGRMHGITGTHAVKANTRSPSPAISQSGTTSASEAKTKVEPKATKFAGASHATTAAPASKSAPKETRLGGTVAAATAQASAAKATRLSAINAVATETAAAVDMNAANEAAGSFFSKLTMVHYAGAGIAALVLIGALVAVPIMFSSKSKDAEIAKPAAEVVKPAEKPQIVEMPKSAAPAAVATGGDSSQTSGAPAMDKGLQTLSPTDSTKSGDAAAAPADSPTKTTATAQKPTEKREAAAPPKTAAPAKPAPAKPKPSGGSARCALTGDC